MFLTGDKNQDQSPDKYTISNPSEWLTKYGNVLYGYAKKLVRDSSTAEDLVQETLLAALKGQAGFGGASSEQTWLIGILKNKVVDHFRKTSREKPMSELEQFDSGDEIDYIISGSRAGSWREHRTPKAWSVDPNDPVEQKQFWDYLQGCMAALDERLAQVYSLRDIMEVDYKEVCNVLDITPTNLRVMLHRARKSLRKCLEENWITD